MNRKESTDMNFKVGDMVKVVDAGSLYTTYDSFFIKHNIMELGLRYQYLHSDINKSATYKIKYIGKHTDSFNMVAVIEEVKDNDYCAKKIYLINVDGLKFARRRMTWEEIEKELGYMVEVIDYED